MKLETDGNDYHVLVQMCEQVYDVPGIICEIGTNKGGGLNLIINKFNSLNQKRIFLAVDPYGDIPYTDIGGTRSVGYNNKIKSVFLKEIYELCDNLEEYLMFLNMTDSQFFKRFADGIPVYRDKNEEIFSEYALVILDGPHSSKDVLYEFEFFKSRMSQGGIIVCDDIEQYPHMEEVDSYITSNGFTRCMLTTYKAAYRKD